MKVAHLDRFSDCAQGDGLPLIEILVDELDRLAQFSRRHSATTRLQILQIAVASDNLHCERLSQRIGVQSSDYVRVFEFLAQRHADAMYMLVSDAKLGGDRNLTVINIYRLGSRPQKLWIEIQIQSVAWSIFLLPINGEAGRDNGDCYRCQ